LIAALKAFAKRHWPALRLRTILFSVLLFAGAMPGIAALFLRVYENTLVRQTEAELVAQGATLVAAAEASAPQVPAMPQVPTASTPEPYASPAESPYRAEPTTIDLSTSPVLPERPAPRPSGRAVDPEALAMARRLAPVIARATHTTLASVMVLDRTGLVASGRNVGGDLSMLPEVHEAMAGKPRTVFRVNGDEHPVYAFEWLSRASGLRLHHARPVFAGNKVVGVLLLSRSPRALFRGIYEDRGKIAFGVVAIFGVLVVLSGLVSRGVTRPIEALSAASREVAAGGGTVPETPATAAIEIRALYEDFRAMAVRIERRSGYLRDFAAAVSHEFKTPLAGINGAAELLQDHFETMSEAERRRFLDNIAADGARLSQLVTRLLDLARADMAAPEADAEAELAAPIRRAADAQAGPGFAVDLDLPASLPPAAAPEATLESVVGVLLQNSRQAGASRATVAVRAEDDRLRLTVVDDGPGVPAPDRERLFEPFFTSRRESGGTGLGLSIARSLLAASNATIDLAPSLTGAVFEVWLPRA
jgi:signal transduction histidine kinase